MAQINNYDWLNCIPQGWKNLARKMIQECEAIYPEWEIFDLKEKWGEIRCDDKGVPSILRKQIDEVIDKYEGLSARTCCVCGAPATKVSTGWICPYCDNCGDKDEKFYKRLDDGN